MSSDSNGRLQVELGVAKGLTRGRVAHLLQELHVPKRMTRLACIAHHQESV